jgi:hypothetical protein
MKHVVVIGPGASGKSTLAVQLGEVTGLPVIELDKVFWRDGLVATPRDRWAEVQQSLVRRTGGSWMATWDLMTPSKFGLTPRTRSFSWIFHLSDAHAEPSGDHVSASISGSGCGGIVGDCDHAHQATVHVLRNPQAVRRFVADAACSTK